MPPPSPKSIPARVELYADLPLDRITPVPCMAELEETFGVFLQSLVGAGKVPDAMIVGGGAGNAFAAVQFLGLVDGVDIGGSVRFGRRPDGAAARLDNITRAPGSIIRVLHDLMTGDAEGHPRSATARLGPGP